MRGKRYIGAVAAIVGIISLFAQQADAARFSSTNYVIDASVANGFGGQDGSTNYSLVGSGGESIIGAASSTSYMVGMGYVAQLNYSIQVTAQQASISFPTLTPGAPQTVALNANVSTDASGYSLAISQNQDLTDASSHTIPKIAATIASPAAWVNGTTKGLGFTIGSATAGVPAKWSGPAYAAMPNSASPTVFYTRSGQPSGTETISLTYKLDTDSLQPSGVYSNIVTLTGTMTP